MGNIVLLDDLTINQIAAGEVLDRPVNAVKELVENSIDAGAKHIVIEIKKGGKSFIRVTDDGKGIKRDDIFISFERHATSKIKNVEDLENTYTMGFRGEALASIVSVSNLTMITKTQEDETAAKVIAKARRNIRDF
jgi:DNA mismatch repair protein MutL